MTTRRLQALDERSADHGVSTGRAQRRVLDFADDGFAFPDARTSGSLALKIGRRVVVSETANAEVLDYAAKAGARLQAEIEKRRKLAHKPEPLVLRKLLPLLPPPRTLTAAEWKASAQTLDDFDAYLRGVVARSTKATLESVA